MSVIPTNHIAIHLWRDYDDEARTQPGMDLGTESIALTATNLDSLARRLFEQGVRRVALNKIVDPIDTDLAWTTVRSLTLIRELTSRAIVVDWQLNLSTDQVPWQLLSHLHPPGNILGPDNASMILQQWRQTHYIGKCVYRRGPGFIQVRDRRCGHLRRITIDDPDYQESINLLIDGAPTDTVPQSIVDDLTARKLVWHVGELAWWLPHRTRRWFHAPTFM